MSMESQSLQLADFIDLFSGDIHNYGVHQYRFAETGKESGTNQTVTNRLLTIEQYKAHLMGQTGLGVIPIDDKGEIKFGVIDLDVYDVSLDAYIEAIEQNGFPLIPFKSKSGGLHLYLFMQQAVNAKAVIAQLNTLVMLLGLDIYIKHKLNRLIEVFPKQVKKTDGSIGSWINLPYYNVASTRQYAIRAGKPLSFNDALAYAKSKRCSLSDISNFIRDIGYRDGPPCLQTLHLLNALGKNSGRNNYLFSFGVYLKKKEPEFWEQQVFELNENMLAPLPKDEVESTVINSLRKRDYTYKCSEQPCVEYCRKHICQKRDYGIGKEGGYFSDLEYGQLVQVKAYEPYYEWEVRIQGETSFKQLRFKNEADIIGQDAFLRLCFRELHLLPIKLKQSEWFKLINQALKDVKIIKVDQDDDTTPIGLFKSLFVEFLTERAMAQTRDQILNKRVFFDEHIKRYYFRTVDLSEYVFVSKGFRYYAPGELHGLLRDFKAQPTRIKTENGKQIRVYEIADADVKNIGNILVEVFKAEFQDGEEAF